MDDRAAVAWLHRRAGWGLAPGQLDAEVARGVDGALDALVDPDAAGVPPAPDPWAALDPVAVPDRSSPEYRTAVRAVVASWLAAFVTTPRPLEERVRWLWHGHFVTGLAEVQAPALVVDQLRMLGRLGLGDVPTLLRAVTVDPAMLRYLDGATNQVGAINENYGRELLELFALGIGSYDEDDVRAASVALSGWVVTPGTGTSRFVPRRHDDTPQRLLGVEGVHDVDSVVAAVVDHPACARHLTRAVATELLGSVDDATLDALSVGLVADGLQLRPLVRAVLEAGLDGAGGPVVLAPVPWFVQVLRALGLTVADVVDGREGEQLLRSAGQIPMFPPNVGGWPGGRAWLSTSVTLARTNLAALAAHAAPPDGPARAAAAAGDPAALADALARPEGFSAETADALRTAARADRSGGADTLAVALASADLVLA